MCLVRELKRFVKILTHAHRTKKSHGFGNTISCLQVVQCSCQASRRFRSHICICEKPLDNLQQMRNWQRELSPEIPITDTGQTKENSKMITAVGVGVLTCALLCLLRPPFVESAGKTKPFEHRELQWHIVFACSLCAAASVLLFG